MIRPLLALGFCLALGHGAAAATPDRFDAAVEHPGRPAEDLKRDAIDHPAELLRLMHLKPGAVVADVLAADGYFSELASYVVGPEGHVLLINNKAFEHWSPDLDKRLAGNRLPNVERVTRELDDLKLKPDSLDAVLLVKVYHDLFWVDPKGEWPRVDADGLLEQLHRALKKDGVLLLVDHSAARGHAKADAGSLHRIEESSVIEDFKRHGFRLEERSQILRKPEDARDQISYKGPLLGKTDRFVLVFRKP